MKIRELRQKVKRLKKVFSGQVVEKEQEGKEKLSSIRIPTLEKLLGENQRGRDFLHREEKTRVDTATITCCGRGKGGPSKSQHGSQGRQVGKGSGRKHDQFFREEGKSERVREFSKENLEGDVTMIR